MNSSPHVDFPRLAVSACRPASVIFKRTTSTVRPPAIMRSTFAIARPAMQRSTSSSLLKPCAIISASVMPSGASASRRRARRRVDEGRGAAAYVPAPHAMAWPIGLRGSGVCVLYEIAAAKSRRGRKRTRVADWPPLCCSVACRDIRQNENPARAAPQARSGVSGEPSGLQLRVIFL
jgi:hypothetical protein